MFYCLKLLNRLMLALFLASSCIQSLFHPLYTTEEGMSNGPPVGLIDVNQEWTQAECPVKGSLPAWLSGSMLRNGPAKFSINGQTVSHWFDGLAMLHLYSMHQGKVTYSNRFLRTDAYTTAFEKGSIQWNSFVLDPCKSLFRKILSLFFTEPVSLKNANVNIAQYNNTYVALTETPLPIVFDPKTLHTVGVYDYQDRLPHKNCWESAHPHVDPISHVVTNYLIEFGTSSYYVVYEIHPGTNERKVIAKIPIKKPSYMHSFALTDHYIILVEFPFVVDPLSLLARFKPFIYNFVWKPELGTIFTVINRKSGAVVGRYPTEAFFAFHHVNAYEKQEDCLILDIVSYADSRIVMDVSSQDFDAASTVPAVSDTASFLVRYELSLKEKSISSQKIGPMQLEMPRVHPHKEGKEYEYVWAVDYRLPKESTQGSSLYKISLPDGIYQTWLEKGCYPGEPIFVPSPHAQREDDGVVLSIVIDLKTSHSFLLVLDGRSFKEIARAYLPHQIPTGSHGQYFSEKG